MEKSEEMVTIIKTVGSECMDIIEEGGGLSGCSDDDDDGCPSSPGSTYDDGADLMTVAMGDEVTAQLAAAGWHNRCNGDFTFYFRFL